MQIKLHIKVNHNNKEYKTNSIVDFDEKDAKALILRGWAEEVKEKKTSQDSGQEDVKAEPVQQEETSDPEPKAPVKPVAKKAPTKKSVARKAKTTAKEK